MIDCRKCIWFHEDFDVDDDGNVFDFYRCEGYGIIDSDKAVYCEQFKDKSKEK